MQQLVQRLIQNRTGQIIWPVLLFLLVVVVAYSNSFTTPFQYDDKPHIRLVRTEAGTYSAADFWKNARAIPIVTIVLQYKLHGDWVVPYHIFNLAIHFLSTVFVYLLVLQLLRRRPGTQFYSAQLAAVVIALVFAAHPLQTQAVTYMVQRMASMAALFFLLGMNLFIFQQSRQSRTKRVSGILLTAGVVLCGLAAFFSKENAIVFPGVLFFAALLFFPKRLKQRASDNPLWSIVLLVVLLVPIVMLRKIIREYPAELQVTPLGEQLTSMHYGLTQLTVLPRYLGQIVLPVGLNIDHTVPMTTDFGVRPALGLFIIIALIGFIGLTYKKNPIIAFGLGWFILTMLVESSIFPISDVYVEHRMYLPIVGLLIAIAPFVYLVFKGERKSRTVAIIAASCLIIVLSTLTYDRNKTWQTELSLWSDSAQKAPHNPRAHYNIAVEQLQLGDATAAAEEFLRTIEVNPKYHQAYNNLGAMMFEAGEYQLAAKYFMLAYSFDTTDERYSKNLQQAIEYLDSPDRPRPQLEMVGAMYH